MTERTRRIGPLATGLRVTVAIGLLYLAGGAGGLSWDVEWYDVVGGLVVLPGLTVLLGLVARHNTAKTHRFTGPAGHALNCLVMVALATNPYTGGAAALFYGTTLLVSSWRGQPGCEVTIVSNWLLGRDDQVGCPLFSPIDALEARQRTRRVRSPVAAHD
jgi:hypothetical protein